MQVPCGKCLNCSRRRVSAWSFRLLQEDKVSTSSYFLTLTYDTDHVPISRNHFLSLNPNDLQLFFKRVRKRHTDSDYNRSLKYYAVGEYGGRFNRPHYHIILFNSELEVLIGKKHAAYVKRGLIKLDGKSQFVSTLWDKGHITIGQVSGASVGYTLKYCLKGTWRPKHRNDDRSPEFSRMSKGLGMSYLTPAMCQWHKSKMLDRMYCNLTGGVKIAMPRYYKLKLYSQGERVAIGKHVALKPSKTKPVSHRVAKERQQAAERKKLYLAKQNQKL